MVERAGLSTAELLRAKLSVPIAGANLCAFGYFRHVLEVVTKVMSVMSKALSVAIA